ncbi:tetratricopeptide repeat protein [Anaerostipes butyraticus]|uniref:tetratricopeptide repeat protein n=2 Tax=Anaerostipes butyraticus TaxID=645466 RepID=UPI0032090EF3
MLDFNEELEKFQPCADLEDAEENFDGDELEQIKQNKTELYKANQMIKKYNQALNYAKQGNDDLAMLQLKNVVAAIPNFTDAYLLMALLSMKAEDYGTAKDALDQIFAIDPENESAKEYMKEFKAEPEEVKAEERKEKKEKKERKERKEKKEKKEAVQDAPKSKLSNPFGGGISQESGKTKSPMFYMVAGIIIGIVVAAVLIYPTVRASFKSQASSQSEDYQEQLLTKETQLKEAQEAQKKAEDELEEYTKNGEKGGIYDTLLTAMQDYTDNKYDEAATALLSIDGNKLTTDNMKKIYTNLTKKVYPRAYSGLYSKGLSAYKSKDYKTAITYLTNATKVDDTQVNAYYYLARAYEDSKDTDNAVKIYNQIIKKFPSTRSASTAKQKVSQLQ